MIFLRAEAIRSTATVSNLGRNRAKATSEYHRDHAHAHFVDPYLLTYSSLSRVNADPSNARFTPN